MNIGKIDTCKECGHDINLHKGIDKGCTRTFSIGKATFKCVCKKCRIEFPENTESVIDSPKVATDSNLLIDSVLSTKDAKSDINTQNKELLDKDYAKTNGGEKNIRALHK